MRALLDLLGLGSAPVETATSDPETIRKIVAELDALDDDRAAYIAGLSYLLGRVAYADQHVSGEETARMEEIVQEMGKLPEEQAVLAVQIAKSQNRLAGGTENFLVARHLRDSTTVEQRRAVLDCLFAVSAADEDVSAEEEAQIRQIASELGLEHADFIGARSRYSAQRSVIKGLRSGPATD